jgi:hypothetical protein
MNSSNRWLKFNFLSLSSFCGTYCLFIIILLSDWIQNNVQYYNIVR